VGRARLSTAARPRPRPACTRPALLCSSLFPLPPSFPPHLAARRARAQPSAVVLARAERSIAANSESGLPASSCGGAYSSGRPAAITQTCPSPPRLSGGGSHPPDRPRTHRAATHPRKVHPLRVVIQTQGRQWSFKYKADSGHSNTRQTVVIQIQGRHSNTSQTVGGPRLVVVHDGVEAVRDGNHLQHKQSA